MNILLATSSIMLNGGGVSSYAWELISTLSQNNKIHVLTNDKGVVDKLDISSVTSTHGKNISFEYATEILNLIKQKDIDLIINSNSAFISVLAPFIKKPILSISHFTDGALAITAGYNHKYLSGIIALSTSAKVYLEKKFGIVDDTLIHIIYNYVDYCDAFSLQKIGNKPLIIVYPGGCALKKSPALVMKALEHLKRTSLDYKFYWLGNTTLPGQTVSLYNEIRDFFAPDKRIIFTGNVSRKKSISLIQSANIFLLPSKGEGCAMTLLEALNAGCIPIVTDSPHASREILSDGKFGIILHNPSAMNLADTLLKIITHHSEYIQDYQKSYTYSHTKLTRIHWQKKMHEAINASLNTQKQYIEFSKSNFRKSINKYNLLIFREMMKAKVLSLKYYIYFNARAVCDIIKKNIPI